MSIFNNTETENLLKRQNAKKKIAKTAHSLERVFVYCELEIMRKMLDDTELQNKLT